MYSKKKKSEPRLGEARILERQRVGVKKPLPSKGEKDPDSRSKRVIARGKVKKKVSSQRRGTRMVQNGMRGSEVATMEAVPWKGGL